MSIPLDAKIAFFLAFSGYLYYLYYVIGKPIIESITVIIIHILPGIFALFGIIINYTIGLNKFFNFCDYILCLIFSPFIHLVRFIESKLPKCQICGRGTIIQHMHIDNVDVNYNDVCKGNKERILDNYLKEA